MLNGSIKEVSDRWAPILEHEDHPAIGDKYKREVTAQLLENQHAANQQQSEMLTEASDTPANVTGNVSKYDPILISLVRRSMPNLIAYDLAGVQPMTGPSGLIFSLRPKYIDGSGNLSADAFYDEADSTHSGTGTQTGSDPSVLNDASPGSYDTGTGITTANGELLGTDSGNPWSEMGFEIDKFTVNAKTRALKAQYSVELAQDMRQIHNLDAESELTNILASEIMAELNREVIRTVYTIAKPGSQQAELTTTGTFDLDADSDGRWSVEKFKGLAYHIEREANVIAKQTRRGRGNVIIADSDTASAMSMAGMLDTAPALQNNLDIDDTGNTFAGVFNSKYRVYIDPYATGQYFVMGYKGNSAWDAGLYYCPYVPLQLYKAIGEDSFQPRIGFKTRYGLAANPFAEGKTEGGGALTANANVYYRRTKVANLL